MRLSCLFVSREIAVVKHVPTRIRVPAGGHLVEVGESNRKPGEPLDAETQTLVEIART